VLGEGGDGAVAELCGSGEREEDGEDVGCVLEWGVLSSCGNTARTRGRTIVDLEVDWGGTVSFLDTFENRVQLLRLLSNRILLRIRRLMCPSNQIHQPQKPQPPQKNTETLQINSFIPQHLPITRNHQKRRQSPKIRQNRAHKWMPKQTIRCVKLDLVFNLQDFA
jgi:hypothetical protein